MKTKTCQLPPAKVSPKLKAETEQCASFAQENLSEYVRKAVEKRNAEIATLQKVAERSGKDI
jgi:hypothetical protein